jgi:hypothetical protein
VIEQRVESISLPSGLDLPDMFGVKTQSRSYDPGNAADIAAIVSAVKNDLAWLNSLPGVIAAATAVPLPQGSGGIGMPFSADPAENPEAATP